MLSTTIKAREARARRALLKDGEVLHKSRARNWRHNNQQGYMIVNLYGNYVVAGSNFDLSLEDVEEQLTQ